MSDIGNMSNYDDRRQRAMDAEQKRDKDGKFASGGEVLKGAGLEHKPGSGYKPELDRYQHYESKKPMPHEHVVAQLTKHGFKPSYSQGGGGYMDKLRPVMGGSHASSWERDAGPYNTERVELHSKNGKDVHRAVHSKHRSD